MGQLGAFILQQGQQLQKQQVIPLAQLLDGRPAPAICPCNYGRCQTRPSTVSFT